MSEFFKSLCVERFRTFSRLDVRDLGRVNLITGRNNSGKSSLLEAIRILASGASLRTIYDILDYREEIPDASGAERVYVPDYIDPFCSLFNGFTDISSSQMGFSIQATGGIPSLSTSIRVSIDWYARRSDSDGQRAGYQLIPANADDDDSERFPALRVSVGEKIRVVPLERLDRRFISMSSLRSDADSPLVPCVYLDPFSSKSTAQLGGLWDAIALTDMEGEIVEGLKVISGDIEAVSMIGNSDRGIRSRTAIARSLRFDRPVPLRTFGDGINRLFGIILSICNARQGVFLIDEIENGLHYSVQPSVWRMIFRLASSLNVQVFATSHSWDCVRAFQEASDESPDEGVLVRLTKNGEETIATRFSEKDLKIVTRDQIEVR